MKYSSNWNPLENAANGEQNFKDAQKQLLKAIKELESIVSRMQFPNDPKKAETISSQLWDANGPIESLQRKFSR